MHFDVEVVLLCLAFGMENVNCVLVALQWSQSCFIFYIPKDTQFLILKVHGLTISHLYSQNYVILRKLALIGTLSHFLS